MRLSFIVVLLPALVAAAILPRDDPSPTTVTTTTATATATATPKPSHACACNATTSSWACTNATTGVLQDFPGSSCDNLPPEMTWAECAETSDAIFCNVDADPDPDELPTGPWACMQIRGSGITTIYWWPDYMCTNETFNEPPPDSISAVLE